MGFCRIVEMGSDEVILRRGDKSTWLYFLLRGELLVFADTVDDEAPINHILPGEMFGDLALIGDSERQATVCSSPSGSGVRLFACDASCFGMLEDDYQSNWNALPIAMITGRRLKTSNRSPKLRFCR